MDVIDELITHCEAWEPWARVMGNVCAGDAAQALRNLRAELAECREVLKQLYNVTLFDYDSMPEFYRKEAHQIVRETVRSALAAKGEGGE